MRTKRFDQKRFYLALDYLRFGRDLTWREVARQSGVNPTTLTRLKQGKSPDADGLTALASWGDWDVRDFLIKEESSP